MLHVMWRMSIGGAERAVYQLVREQRARGVEADVVVGTEMGIYAEHARSAGAEVFELRCRNALDFRCSRILTRLARGYDIVHHHGIEPLLIAAAAHARRPRLVYTHRSGIRSHGPRKRLRLAVARPYLRRFTAVSGNTRHSALVFARFLGIPESDVAVVYNGLDFDLLAPKRPKFDVLAELPEQARSAFIVGTASHLQPLKRVDLLLKALAALSDADVHCIVLGDGPQRRSLEQISRELGLMDRVSFLGRREHVGDYLQVIHGFVLPSGPEEAFGNAAVEAMGVGVPTIIFADGGGLTEHITDRATGLVVKDVAGLTAALARLYVDEQLRREIGARGREYVRTSYSVDAMVERYAALYEGALALPLN